MTVVSIITSILIIIFSVYLIAAPFFKTKKIPLVKRDYSDGVFLNLARLISSIETTPSYGVEEGVLLKPKMNHMDGGVGIISKKYLYASLNEIELDYHMSKLSEEDYLDLKKQYESLIAKILREEQKDENKSEVAKLQVNGEIKAELLKEIEDEIEQDLNKIRQERRGK